jgi:GNAT superfamily N-acetyltransferase
MNHIIRQYKLEAGAQEVAYMEETFTEFAWRKSAGDIIHRLRDREHLILLSMVTSPDDPGHEIPVAFKVGHELRVPESDLALADLGFHLSDVVHFTGRKVFYSWIGGTRKKWRGQGHYRALTEQQEEWAHEHGYHELIVKTKNKNYSMRATLDHLRFDIIKFEADPLSNEESKMYLSKRIGTDVLKQHQTSRSVVEAA